MENMWGILGIAVSLVFGVVGIILTIKSKYSGKITFINLQTIELFDAIGSSLEKLAVTYDGTNVSENLVLLNGAFINSGRTDISGEMVEKPLTLKLPEGYKWLTGNVVESEANARLSIVDDTSMELSTGLFRCNEYLKFHALAQLPVEDGEKSSSRRFRDALSFDHRISNTKPVEVAVFQPQEKIRENLKRVIVSALVPLMVIIGFVASDFILGKPNEIIFSYNTGPDTVEQTRVTPTRNTTVKLESLTGDFRQEVPFGEFVSNLSGAPVLMSRKWDLTEIILVSLVSLFILYSVFGAVVEFVKNRRLLRILESKDRTQSTRQGMPLGRFFSTFRKLFLPD
ncbi:hypothetical protein [Emcibacter sp.]|uniref:hypothetical protein n=1 Tax=Emcibacter sp. TaxID=1979954 RepID=UPI003A8F6901